MLNKIVNTFGVSGYESDIADYIVSEIGESATIDKVGNVFFISRGTEGKKKILISAHMDEVGFQLIKKIAENKYRIKPLGNIKTWNAIQQRIISKQTTGVLYAINEDQLVAHNYDNIYMSVIAGEEPKIGDVFTFASNFSEGNTFYSGKALDNRLSCELLLDILKMKIKTRADIYYVFTVQEEIGMRGTRVAKSSIAPDLCINVDMSAECDMNSLEIGKGVGIKISDSISVSSNKWIENFEKIAIDNQIVFQKEVSDCGTSELIITNELDKGCDEIGISIPCKYLHSANSVVSKNDYSEAKKLLIKILDSL